jgi:hypothetical protein
VALSSRASTRSVPAFAAGCGVTVVFASVAEATAGDLTMPYTLDVLRLSSSQARLR